MTERRWRELPAPDPDMVYAVRAHLTGKYARGVDRLMWETHKRPLGDAQAVRAVIRAAADGEEADATDLGAALVLMQAVRLDVDRLEWEIFEAARDSGLQWESIAAVLDLSGAVEAQERHRWLESRRAAPVAVSEPPDLAAPDHAREGAERAGRRARSAADRASQAAHRREELRDGQPPVAPSEQARLAATRSVEAHDRGAEARERAAISFLRAADSHDRAAAQAERRAATLAAGRAIGAWDESAELTAKATELRNAAETYRRLAERMRLS